MEQNVEEEIVDEIKDKVGERIETLEHASKSRETERGEYPPY